MNKIALGQVFEQEFLFTQDQVIAFADVTGDKNPIHLDAKHAANTVYKKPIIHGYLGGSIFSRIFGNDFPGEGTVYLNQKLEFRRPMYTGVRYKAILEVKEINEARHKALIDTRIINTEDDKPVITGEANVIHKEKIG
ncbi:MaoC family dehydratase [Fulvivirgaceae bacterium BMA10]|uniref:MaoC family dehydratase n=1 Tax=Splendidivirga corallicola TaxID=3051826 RepID=A0ABT8KLM4_9BACT|nr:MaoC family dehydratase [Fulvivirgaceae bacterium BMA10]